MRALTTPEKPRLASFPAPVELERGRIVSIDVLRGLVMALMALDHARDFFSATGFNPRDVTEPALFLTRWITHFCAPTFIFLAGLSAYLYGRARRTGELSRFLLTRGLWLILLEFTLIQFAWTFEFGNFHDFGAGVIWAIGASMIALAALIWLPRWAIAAIAFALIAGHNLFDSVRAEALGAAAPLWHVLHQPGNIHLGGGVTVFIFYPLVPWMGVMAAGYLLGPLMQRGAEERRRALILLGGAVTLGFILLRAANLYGDPAPWSTQATPLATLLSFLNTEKYPPSLLYLAMTLGPALMLLGAFEHARGRLADWLAVFGRVPFFYYVVHIYLLHALAVAVAFASSGALAANPKLDFGLPGVYFVWLAVLVVLYPPCRWFAALKARHKDWWLSYV
jgi:uncharacterized membrane protein